MSTLHRNMDTDADQGVLLHAPGFVASTDPASTWGTGSSDGVFAGLLWIEESSTDTFDTLKYRNSSNDGWIEMDLDVSYDDDEKLEFGTGADYWLVYNSSGTQFELWTTDADGGGSDGLVFDVADGADVLDFTSTPTVGGTALVLETLTLTAGTNLTGGGDLSANRTFNLADSIDLAGTLDVTGAGTFDSTVTSVGACTWDTGGNGSSFGGDLEVGSILYVNESANANMTTGLTINQGSANDEILTLKSSAVAHKFTAFQEADTYAAVDKADGGTGGMSIEAFSERTDGFAFRMRAHADDLSTGKASNDPGAFVWEAYVDDGANSRTAPTGDKNIVVVRAGASNVFMFTAEGGFYLGGDIQARVDPLGINSADGSERIAINNTGLGLYGATPVAQPTTGIAEAAFVENSGGTAVNVDSTFGGYTLQQIAQILLDVGLAS